MANVSSTLDMSVLPEPARRELQDFYDFLAQKYAVKKPRKARSKKVAANSAPVAGEAPDDLIHVRRDKPFDRETISAAGRRQWQKLRAMYQERDPFKGMSPEQIIAELRRQREEMYASETLH